MYIRDNLGHDKILVPQEWHMHDGETASDSIGAFAFFFFFWLHGSWSCPKAQSFGVAIGHSIFR
jgi:hypothetical protein